MSHEIGLLPKEYGLNVFKSDGTVGFSTADITWQTLDQFTVPASAATATHLSHTIITKSYSHAAGFTIIAQRQMVNVPPASQEDYVPDAVKTLVYEADGTVSGTTLTISRQSGLSSSECIFHVLAQDNTN